MLDSDLLLAEPLDDIVDAAVPFGGNSSPASHVSTSPPTYVAVRTLHVAHDDATKHSSHMILGVTPRNPIMHEALLDIMRFRSEWIWGPFIHHDPHEQFHLRYLLTQFGAHTVRLRKDAMSLGGVADGGSERHFDLASAPAKDTQSGFTLSFQPDNYRPHDRLKYRFEQQPTVLDRYRKSLALKVWDAEKGKMKENFCGLEHLMQQTRLLLRLAEYLWYECSPRSNSFYMTATYTPSEVQREQDRLANGFLPPTTLSYEHALHTIRDCVDARRDDIADLILYSESEDSATTNGVTSTDEASTTSKTPAMIEGKKYRGWTAAFVDEVFEKQTMDSPVFVVAQLILFDALAKLQVPPDDATTESPTQVEHKQEELPHQATVAVDVDVADKRGKRRTSGSKRYPRRGRWLMPQHYQNFNAKLWQLIHQQNTSQPISYLHEYVQDAVDKATLLTAPARPFVFELDGIEEEEGHDVDVEGGRGRADIDESRSDLEVRFVFNQTADNSINSNANASSTAVILFENVTFSIPDEPVAEEDVAEKDPSVTPLSLPPPKLIQSQDWQKAVTLREFLLDREPAKTQLRRVIEDALQHTTRSFGGPKNMSRTHNNENELTTDITTSSIPRRRPTTTTLKFDRVVASHHHKFHCPAFFHDDEKIPALNYPTNPTFAAIQLFQKNPRQYGLDCYSEQTTTIQKEHGEKDDYTTDADGTTSASSSSMHDTHQQSEINLMRNIQNTNLHNYYATRKSTGPMFFPGKEHFLREAQGAQGDAKLAGSESSNILAHFENIDEKPPSVITKRKELCTRFHLDTGILNSPLYVAALATDQMEFK
ncbi:unnamed protein product [Amoebophrya sp. A25]|nr:unnamed protein product [Amoebophrya sp. A25]|eukprot:GSA25T00021179001.1